VNLIRKRRRRRQASQSQLKRFKPILQSRPERILHAFPGILFQFAQAVGRLEILSLLWGEVPAIHQTVRQCAPAEWQ
jgi:hypothetical protein